MLEELLAADRRARDFTRTALSEAIRETIACFPVYRTYQPTRQHRRKGSGPKYSQQAIARARRRNPGVTVLLFDWLQDVLLLKQRDFAGCFFSVARTFHRQCGHDRRSGVSEVSARGIYGDGFLCRSGYVIALRPVNGHC